MTAIASLTTEGMKTVLRRIAALDKERRSPEEFETQGRAIFAEQRIIDAPKIATPRRIAQ